MIVNFKFTNKISIEFLTILILKIDENDIIYLLIKFQATE